MHKYKLIVEYDGTNYHGWQMQKNAKSVQDTLITAAQKFTGAPVKVQGAGRTDAGVHALAQTAHLESSQKFNPETLRIGINDNLPASINVLADCQAACCPAYSPRMKRAVSKMRMIEKAAEAVMRVLRVATFRRPSAHSNNAKGIKGTI